MIYVMQNKEADFPKYKGYEPLLIGDMFTGEYEDNIEYLNPVLNEYTGMYLMWKYKTDEIIGLSHYRRFFIMNGYFLKHYEAENILKEVDMITTYDYRVWDGIYRNFKYELCESDRPVLDKYLNLLYEKEPKLKSWLNNSYEFNPRNMFVCRKELIDDYFAWIFPLIIPWAERFLKEDYEHVQNKRMLAYISERLFGYWIKERRVCCHRLAYFQLGQSWTEE